MGQFIKFCKTKNLKQSTDKENETRAPRMANARNEICFQNCTHSKKIIDVACIKQKVGQ